MFLSDYRFSVQQKYLYQLTKSYDPNNDTYTLTEMSKKFKDFHLTNTEYNKGLDLTANYY